MEELIYRSKFTGGEIDARLEAVEKAVLVISQTLSDPEKAQARENIDVIGGKELSDLVKFIRAEKMRREYLTIESTEDDCTVIFLCPNDNSYDRRVISVSTNNGVTWEEKTSAGYPGTVIANLNAGEKVLLKGENESMGFLDVNTDEYLGNGFIVDAPCYVYGNVMSLIYGDDFADKYYLPSQSEGTFATLFGDWSEDYSNNHVMVDPLRPLVLPAVSLGYSCYSYMFYNCTSLRFAPELPAEYLYGGSYIGMFYGCTNLTSAPELPATTLANGCYQSMFSGCTGLTSAPELPATTLASYCYASMFDGCAGLNYVKCLATDISANNSLNNWLNGVAATGTFVKAAGMTDWPTGESGIPSGWTVQEAA